MVDYCYLSIAKVRELIREQKVSPVEIVEDFHVLVRARFRLQLLDATFHRGSFLVRESFLRDLFRGAFTWFHD